MRILKMFPGSINERYLSMIADTLEDGGLIIYPTDTAYAIGCDALNNRAIEKICKIKGTDPKKSRLSIICSDISQASRYAQIDNMAFTILRRNLPGAFTFILPASPSLPKAFRGRHQVGIRIPDNNIPRAIAESLGRPLLTAGIIMPGSMMTINPEELADTYGQHGIEITVDDGEREIAESTVVNLTNSNQPEIVRQGKGIFE